jgi:molybdenum cofactor biosynthesis enzyme MoaA
VQGIRRVVPHASIGLADLYICGMNYFPFDVHAVMHAVAQADWVLVGEGEVTLPELVRRLEARQSIEGLPRVAVRTQGDILYNPSAPQVFSDLDALPLPAFDLLNMEHYFGVQAGALQADLVHEYHVVERQLPLMTSRSCPYRCHFCTNQVLGLPWRAHSVSYVRQAVRTLRQQYGVQRFLWLDDNINVDAKRFRDLVLALEQEGVPWDAVNGYRADRLDREMVRAIKAAGNTKITVSAESGDPTLLDKLIRKGLKLSSVVNLARVCEEERIPLQVHYIVGVPGETKAQINQTLEFATVLFEKHGAWPLLQHAIPFPGTGLFRDCEEKGYFIAPPFEIAGSVLEEESIIRTPEFEPAEVLRMKRNAQHLHAAMQKVAFASVTSRCDSDCLACHCHSSTVAHASPSIEELCFDLERAQFLGAQEVILGGGEPTMRPDLPSIVTAIKNTGFHRVTLLTNAHGLASAKRVQALSQAGVDAIAVDMLAHEATLHDDLTRMKGAWKLMVLGMNRARQAGWSIDVHIPVLRANLSTLAETVQLAFRLGAKTVHFQIAPPPSPALKAGQIPRWNEAVGPMLRAIGGSRRGSTWIQGAPLCLLPSRKGLLRPLPPWALQASRAHKMKHAVCRQCVAYLLCGGFFRPEYEPAYGMMAALGLEASTQSDEDSTEPT